MSEPQNTPMATARTPTAALSLTNSRDLSDLPLPDEAKSFLRHLLSECNKRVSYQLSTFPNAHEESLDLVFIAHLASLQGIVQFGPHWTLRLEAHYIGGGRHYRTWEVADLGLIAIFRRNGLIKRSKLAFFQSKKLYATPLRLKIRDPYYRMGMGRLLVTDDEHNELVKPRLLRYSERSKYQALKADGVQRTAMREFADRFNVKLYYLLYNPASIPWDIRSPVEQQPQIPTNEVGCRIVPKDLVEKVLNGKRGRYSPSFRDMKDVLGTGASEDDSMGGWRMERFVCDLFIAGAEGVVDDSPNYHNIASLLTQKTSPISSALSITFDYHD